MSKKELKLAKGITMVSLIVIIVILLILAGVTIASLTGSGLFNKTEEAKVKAREATAEEQVNLEIMRVQTEKRGKATIQDLYNDFSDEKNQTIIVTKVGGETAYLELEDRETVPQTINQITVKVEGYDEFDFTIGSECRITEICGEPKEDWNGKTFTGGVSVKEYTLSYNFAGGQNGPANVTQEDNKTFTIPSTTPTKSGYRFTGWKDESGNDYSAGDTVTITSGKRITLTAQWQATIGNLIPGENETAKEFSTTEVTTIEDNYGNQVKVPAGFGLAKDSGSTVSEGIVIEDVTHEDTAGSQFVWVPVGTVYTSNGENRESTKKAITLGRYTFNSSTGVPTLKQNATNYTVTNNMRY